MFLTIPIYFWKSTSKLPSCSLASLYKAFIYTVLLYSGGGINIGKITNKSRVGSEMNPYLLTNFQVGLLGIQMVWTRDAEDALSNARSDKKVHCVVKKLCLLYCIYNCTCS